MKEDTEKRLQRIMDKLYHSPKPRFPPHSGGGGTNAQQMVRRREPAGSRVESENSMRHTAATVGARDGGPAPCRPWDRGDLTRRLATFKAMTWFGKPKAIDPVNCARRGWINVEMDTLACEACAARLLFSTPSSWTLQQVEKAAAVFSLKLDGGHKLLCPWIDNICDEGLAFFPPTPAPALIESYQERSAALLQLSALPLISSSAINYMRSHQLENFLAKSSSVAYRLDGNMKLTDSSGNIVLDSVPELESSNQYYQAHKIISLCGWEPRLLPYVVDCEDRLSHSKKKDMVADSLSETLCQKNHAVIVYSSTVSSENAGEWSDQPPLDDQYDPASVVLDCKLCGACVGLWAFKTIVRPLELFNLIESPEDNGQKGPATDGSDGSASNEKLSILNLTIAGGPPPTKQNFKPRISLPIVTRHLRAAFGSNGDIRYHASSNIQGRDQLNAQSSLDHQGGNGCTSLRFSSEASGLLKCKRSEDKYCTPGGSTYIEPHLNENISSDVDALRNEGRNGDMPSTHQTEEGLLHEERCEQTSAKTNECLKNADKDLIRSATITEDAENGRFTSTKMGDYISLQPGNGTCIIPGSTVSKDDDVISVMGVTSICSQDGFSRMDVTSQFNDHSYDIPSVVVPKGHMTSDADVTENLHGKDVTHIGGCAEIHAIQPHMEGGVDSQKVPVLKNTAMNAVDAEVVTLCTSRNNPSSASQWDNTNKFDPIRQHRPFCPWIVPMDEKNMPGWELTLRALVQDEYSSQAEAQSSVSDEVNDPIVSVRKIFMSPRTKRFKGAR